MMIQNEMMKSIITWQELFVKIQERIVREYKQVLMLEELNEVLDEEPKEKIFLVLNSLFIFAKLLLFLELFEQLHIQHI